MSQVAAIDVGGTFTDIVLLDEATGQARFGKVPTTPSNPADGVLAAFDALDVDFASLDAFLHGTTIGLNALLERKAQSVGLITTKGFRDVLEIRRASWPMYRLHWDQPEPLVPRHLRLEVTERVLADGSIDTALDVDELRVAARALVDQGVEAIAVCLLHSYARPEHEEICGRIIREEFPQVEVSVSHEITREYREYERTCTTVVDAALKPIMVRYLRQVEERLAERGFTGSFMITRCDGGVMSVDEACEKVIRVLISGPASGIMGAAALAKVIGAPRVIACDMGGTSFDMALILDGEPDLDSLTHVEGIPLLMPVVGMHAIGAGGGSIAWLDDGGALNFGPQSAGADPGPVCYGHGGTLPTFTDAAVISGLIDPAYFLGGRLSLDIASARAAIDEHVARPLGLAGIDEAASGVIDLAESKMAAALESITVEKGYDPREFVLLAFGGGGPLVAPGLARRLEIPRVVVPESPGTFSARGMTALDLVHDFARTAITGEAAIGSVATSMIAELRTEGDEALAREGVQSNRRELQAFIDARYSNQEHTITLALGANENGGLSSEEIRTLFDDKHETVYSYRMSDPIEAVAFRVRAVGRRSAPITRRVAVDGPSGEPTPKGARRASHPQSGQGIEWSIYERSGLPVGTRVDGPAILEEESATTLVHVGQHATVDEFGNLFVDAD